MEAYGGEMRVCIFVGFELIKTLNADQRESAAEVRRPCRGDMCSGTVVFHCLFIKL